MFHLFHCSSINLNMSRAFLSCSSRRAYTTTASHAGPPWSCLLQQFAALDKVFIRVREQKVRLADIVCDFEVAHAGNLILLLVYKIDNLDSRETKGEWRCVSGSVLKYTYMWERKNEGQAIRSYLLVIYTRSLSHNPTSEICGGGTRYCNNFPRRDAWSKCLKGHPEREQKMTIDEVFYAFFLLASLALSRSLSTHTYIQTHSVSLIQTHTHIYIYSHSHTNTHINIYHKKHEYALHKNSYISSTHVACFPWPWWSLLPGGSPVMIFTQE